MRQEEEEGKAFQTEKLRDSGRESTKKGEMNKMRGVERGRESDKEREKDR